jgi:acetoin utilization protein AcuB
MLISDVMKTNVISVPNTTTLAEARKIMDAHNIRRLPVITKLKLEGIVTKDDLDKMGPSQLTTFNVNELVYLLNRITVKDVMHRDVITVPQDTTIEEAVSLAQGRRVGLLLITENDRVIGIATTNDIFLHVLNPLFGIGKPGTRVAVLNCFTGPDIEKVLSAVNKLKIGVINLFVTEFPEVGKHDLIMHLDALDGTAVTQAIEQMGFNVDIRKR